MQITMFPNVAGYRFRKNQMEDLDDGARQMLETSLANVEI